MLPILVIGHAKDTYEMIERKLSAYSRHSFINFENGLPNCRMENNHFLVLTGEKSYSPVAGVIYHAPQPNDIPFLQGLALSSTPCFPCARATLKTRRKIDLLIDLLNVTTFGETARSFLTSGPFDPSWTTWVKKAESGVDLCTAVSEVEGPTLFEEYINGNVMRVICYDGKHWHSHQVRMGKIPTQTWRCSATDEKARFLRTIDASLSKDANQISSHLGSQILGVDYVLNDFEGTKHFIGVTTSPDIDSFSNIRNSYIDTLDYWYQSEVLT